MQLSPKGTRVSLHGPVAKRVGFDVCCLKWIKCPPNWVVGGCRLHLWVCTEWAVVDLVHLAGDVRRGSVLIQCTCCDVWAPSEGQTTGLSHIATYPNRMIIAVVYPNVW